MSTSDRAGRRIVRRTAGTLGVVASGWAALLFATGGLDTVLFGLRLTAHNPIRPALFAGIAFTAYFLAGGDDAVVRWTTAATRRLLHLVSALWSSLGRIPALARRWHLLHAGAVVIAGSLAFFGITRGAKVAGGADSYGYVSQADLFLEGRVTDPQPWAGEVPWPNAIETFTPLGFRAAPDHWIVTPPMPHGPRDPWSISPRYSPGLSLLMAGFKLVAGQEGVFWVVPLAGAVLVLATFAIGRRLGSTAAGLMAAWLVATSPNVLEMSGAPMSDVPVAAAWAVMYWALLGRTKGAGILAAIAGGLAIFIRPNLFFMAGAVGLLLVQRVWAASRTERQAEVRRAALVSTGLLSGMIAAASINWAAHGSPFVSGYGTLSDVLDWSHVGPNVPNYFRWFIEQQTPFALLGLAALVVPVRWLWPGISRRSTLLCLAVFVAGIWIEYFYWEVFETSLYLRFLLSTWPFIMLGLSNVALAPSRVLRGVPHVLATTAAMVFVGALGYHGLVRADAIGVFTEGRGESKYVTIALEARRLTPPNAVIFSMQHSGSVRYYAGRMSVRYDALPSDWLTRAVAFLSSQGVDSYVLLDGWERDQFLAHFGDDPTAALIKRAPVVRFREIALYALTPHAGDSPTTIELPESAAVLAAVPPAPAPTLVLIKK